LGLHTDYDLMQQKRKLGDALMHRQERVVSRLGKGTVMMNWLTSGRCRDIAFLLVGGIVASVLGGTVIAIIVVNVTSTTEKTGYLSIHPMDLTPMSSGIDYAIEVNGALRLSDGRCASTGINLPQGAKVVSLLTVFTAAADTATNPSVALVRNNWATDGVTYLVGRGFANTSGTRKSVSTPVPANLSIINNAAYSYSFAVCLGTGDWFEGVRITYRYKTAGD